MGERQPVEDREYETRYYPRIRRVISDAGRLARRRQFIHGVIEADVTITHQHIRERRLRTGRPLSVTAYVIWCLGQAVSEHPQVHALRGWGRRLVIYHNVDVYTLVEIHLDGDTFPRMHVIRNVNNITPEDVESELESVRNGRTGEDQLWRLLQWFVWLPRPLRILVQSFILRSPRLFRKYSGTVELSAVGMFGRGGGWGLYNPNHTLAVVVGGLGRKPGVVNGEIEPREFLDLTVQVDHDIVDGAPAARFSSRLKQLIESGAGLEQAAPEEAAAGGAAAGRASPGQAAAPDGSPGAAAKA